MWTETTRPKYDRKGVLYTSDMTDAEWAVISRHLPEPKLLGRPRGTELREVVNALFYMARTGCQWKLLPSDLPHYSTVQYYFYSWRDNGANQFRTAVADSRSRGSRGESLRRDHRQPIGQDHRERWSERVRRRQKG